MTYELYTVIKMIYHLYNCVKFTKKSSRKVKCKSRNGDVLDVGGILNL